MLHDGKRNVRRWCQCWWREIHNLGSSGHTESGATVWEVEPGKKLEVKSHVLANGPVHAHADSIQRPQGNPTLHETGWRRMWEDRYLDEKARSLRTRWAARDGSKVTFKFECSGHMFSSHVEKCCKLIMYLHLWSVVILHIETYLHTPNASKQVSIQHGTDPTCSP